VNDVLAHRPAHLDLVLRPHPGEPRRQRQHLGDQSVDAGVARVAGVGGAQVGHRGPGEADEVGVAPDDVLRCPQERPADHVPVLVLGQVADEVGREPVPGQHVAGRVEHVGRDRRHAVEQVPHARGDLPVRPGRRRRRLAGHAEQVVALVRGEHQRPGQRGQHLPGGVRPAGLLQPDVVVHRQARQLGHLLTAQPWRAASVRRARLGQAGLTRAQPGAPGSQEPGQLGATVRVHVPHSRSAPAPGGWYCQSQARTVSPRFVAWLLASVA